MDLSTAYKTHVQWRIQLKEAIRTGEKLDVATIKRDDCCDLGKWLHGQGKGLYGAKPEFVKLVETHYVFHLETAIVANAINALDHQTAIEMMDMSRAFGRASLEVGMAINALKAAID
jgi:hypothetical protein